MSIESFNGVICDQLRDYACLTFIAPVEKWPVMPASIGRWLANGKASAFRALMREHKLKAADLVAHWLNQWPVVEPVGAWGKNETVAAYAKWPLWVRRIYAQKRQEAVRLFAVGGKLTGPLRVACGRYGAWWAVAALKPIVDTKGASLPDWKGCRGLHPLPGEGRTLEWMSWVRAMNQEVAVRA